jgi:predicted nucleic acid-binding protein
LEKKKRHSERRTICQRYQERQKAVIIDNDVLVWYLRGNEKAQKEITANIPFRISAINYMELLRGMRDKKELRILQKYFRQWSVEALHITENISTRAMFLMEDYFLSHSLEMADAIIAATALEYHEVILTANEKHYGFIPNIQIKKFRP